MSDGAVAMAARPKQGSKKPEKASDDRVVVIHLKGTVEYAQWLEDLYRDTHIPKSSMFRLAMAEWAKSKGHSPPPEF